MTRLDRVEVAPSPVRLRALTGLPLARALTFRLVRSRSPGSAHRPERRWPRSGPGRRTRWDRRLAADGLNQRPSPVTRDGKRLVRVLHGVERSSGALSVARGASRAADLVLEQRSARQPVSSSGSFAILAGESWELSSGDRSSRLVVDPERSQG